jgi:hypothetical protein
MGGVIFDFTLKLNIIKRNYVKTKNKLSPFSIDYRMFFRNW